MNPLLPSKNVLDLIIRKHDRPLWECRKAERTQTWSMMQELANSTWTPAVWNFCSGMGEKFPLTALGSRMQSMILWHSNRTGLPHLQWPAWLCGFDSEWWHGEIFEEWDREPWVRRLNANKKQGAPLNEKHPICPTVFGLTNGAFLYVEKNERRIAENESNFYSARCFAR